MANPANLLIPTSDSVFEADPELSYNEGKCEYVYLSLDEPEMVLDCTTDLQNTFTMFAVSISTIVAQRPLNNQIPQMSADYSRKRIWKIIAGDRPMPEPQEGAVDACFGFLSYLIDEDSEEEEGFDDILRDIRGK